MEENKDQEIGKNNVDKQLEDAKKVANLQAEALAGTPTSIYNRPAISLVWFVILVVVTSVVTIFGTSYIIKSLGLIGLLGYSIIMLLSAFFSYNTLKNANHPGIIGVSIFTFAFVSTIQLWVGAGGILSAFIVWWVLSNNNWI